MAINGILIPETGSAQSAGLDFNALTTALTTGTLTGLTITADSINENFDIIVDPLSQIDIDSNGYWVINGTTTTHYSKGTDGQNGTNGQDGVTPHIDNTTKHWMIGATDTQVVAEGQDGNDGQDGVSPTVSFSTITGGNRMTVVDGSGTSSIDIMNGITTISTNKIDLTCTALAANWTQSNGKYTQTITVSGLTSSLHPILDVIISDTVATGIEEQKQWAYITKAVTGDGTLTLYCYEHQPTIDLNILIGIGVEVNQNG